MNLDKNLAVLIVRIIIGGIFIIAGWMKVSDMAMAASYFNDLGIATFLAYIVAYAELLGGLALVLGLWQHISATVLGVIMLGAIYYSVSGGFPGVMGPLSLLAGLVSLLGTGPGKFTVRSRALNS